MKKRSFLVGAAVLAGCFIINAQQIDHRDSFGSLHRGAVYVPGLALSDSHAFPFGSSFAWMEPAPNNFLPSWRPDNWDRNLSMADSERRPYFASGPGGYSKDSKDIDSSGASVSLQKNLFDYVHGEVGFFYGHSSGGRNSLSTEGTYINATTGNDKFQLSVGGYYENTNFDVQRRGH
jgi:hypothetical protein